MSKIAFISTMNGDAWGGSEYLWAASAQKALEDNHEVFISIYDWSANHPIVQHIKSLGAKILPRTRSPESPSIATRITRKIAAYLRSPFQDIFDIQPDVICISQGSTWDIRLFPDLALLIDSSSIPFVTICHHNMETAVWEGDRLTLLKFLEKANKVLFVSQHNLDLAKRQIAAHLPNAEIIKNPVNLKSTEIEPFPTTSKVNLASVSRLDAFVKGHDILFEALSTKEWKSRDWECNLYGTGRDLAYLKNLTAFYGIQDKVKFQGHTNDVRKIWAENHILVLPSRAEGTPLALIESMLCGRPSVATDVGGNAEWIDEGETGFIAAATTISSFRSALELAWCHQEKWEEMGELAHESARERLDENPGGTLLQHLLGALR
jgi:L-malate glycosyltransferase